MRMNVKALAIAGVILTGAIACTSTGKEDSAAVSEESVAFAYTCQETLSTNEPLASTGLPGNVILTGSPLGFQVPMSDTAGGCEQLESGARAGFARTETGAALAALNAALGYHPGGSQAMLDEAEAKISASQHWDQMKAGSEQYLASGEQLPDASTLKVTGFTVQNYSPNKATIQVFITPKNRVETYKMTVNLIWEKDWKIITGPSDFYIDTTTTTEKPQFSYIQE